MLAGYFLNALWAVMTILGKALKRLIYGKEGWKAAKILKGAHDGTEGFLSLVALFWLGGIFFMPTGLAAYESCITVILTSIILMVWAIYANKVTVPKLIEDAKPILRKMEEELQKKEEAERRKEETDIAAAAEIKNNSWVCSCGRTHPPYVSDCVCGGTKQEAKLRSMQNQK